MGEGEIVTGYRQEDENMKQSEHETYDNTKTRIDQADILFLCKHI